MGRGTPTETADRRRRASSQRAWRSAPAPDRPTHSVARRRRTAGEGVRPVGPEAVSAAAGRWWGVFAPLLRAPRRGRLGGRELLRARWSAPMGRRPRRLGDGDPPPVRAVPGRADARAEPLLAREPSLLERDLHRRHPGARARRVRRGSGGAGRSGVPRADRAAAQGRPRGSSGRRRRRSGRSSTPWRSRRSEGRLPPVSPSSRGTPEPPTTRGSEPRCERRGAWWGAWPDAERNGSLAGAALDDDRARYHLFVQWVAARAAGRGGRRRPAPPSGGLMLDLPIGVNGAGYDVWRER